MVDSDDLGVWSTLHNLADEGNIGRIVDNQPTLTLKVVAFLSFGVIVAIGYFLFLLRFFLNQLIDILNHVLHFVNHDPIYRLDQSWAQDITAFALDHLGHIQFLCWILGAIVALSCLYAIWDKWVTTKDGANKSWDDFFLNIQSLRRLQRRFIASRNKYWSRRESLLFGYRLNSSLYFFMALLAVLLIIILVISRTTTSDLIFANSGGSVAKYLRPDWDVLTDFRPAWTFFGLAAISLSVMHKYTKVTYVIMSVASLYALYSSWEPRGKAAMSEYSYFWFLSSPVFFFLAGVISAVACGAFWWRRYPKLSSTSLVTERDTADRLRRTVVADSRTFLTQVKDCFKIPTRTTVDDFPTSQSSTAREATTPPIAPFNLPLTPPLGRGEDILTPQFCKTPLATENKLRQTTLNTVRSYAIAIIIGILLFIYLKSPDSKPVSTFPNITKIGKVSTELKQGIIGEHMPSSGESVVRDSDESQFFYHGGESQSGDQRQDMTGESRSRPTLAATKVKIYAYYPTLQQERSEKSVGVDERYSTGRGTGYQPSTNNPKVSLTKDNPKMAKRKSSRGRGKDAYSIVPPSNYSLTHILSSFARWYAYFTEAMSRPDLKAVQRPTPASTEEEANMHSQSSNEDFSFAHVYGASEEAAEQLAFSIAESLLSENREPDSDATTQSPETQNLPPNKAKDLLRPCRKFCPWATKAHFAELRVFILKWRQAIVSDFAALYQTVRDTLAFSSRAFKTTSGGQNDVYMYFFLLCLCVKFSKIIHGLFSSFFCGGQQSFSVAPTVKPDDVTVIIPVCGEILDEDMFRTSIQEILNTRVHGVFLIPDTVANEANVQAALRNLGGGRWYVGPGNKSIPSPRKRELIHEALQYVETRITCVSDPKVSWGPNFLRSALTAFENPVVNVVGSTRSVERKRNFDGFWKTFMDYMTCVKIQKLDFENTSAFNIDGGVSIIPNSTWLARTEVLEQRHYRDSLLKEEWFGKAEKYPNEDYYTTRYFTTNGHGIGWVNNPILQDRPQISLSKTPTTLSDLIYDAGIHWRHVFSLLFDGKVWRSHPWSSFFLIGTQFIGNGNLLELLTLIFWTGSQRKFISGYVLFLLHFIVKVADRKIEQSLTKGSVNYKDIVSFLFSITVWPIVEGSIEAWAGLKTFHMMFF